MYHFPVKAVLNGIDFSLPDIHLNECRAKFKQKLDEVFKRFRHNTTFLRTKEKKDQGHTTRKNREKA